MHSGLGNDGREKEVEPLSIFLKGNTVVQSINIGGLFFFTFFTNTLCFQSFFSYSMIF